MSFSTSREYPLTGQATSPQSPINSPVIHRQESVLSRVSTGSDGHIRHRRTSRADTVTVYRPADHADWQPGAEPGIDPTALDKDLPQTLTDLHAQCDIRIIDFSEADVVESMADNDTIETFLDEPRRDDLPCRWISVNGLSWDVIKILGEKFNLHRLAIEDLIHRSRTKVDWYADNAFIVLTLQKLVRLHQNCTSDDECQWDTSPDSSATNEKTDFESSRKAKWWRRSKSKRRDVLPRYLDKNADVKMDEFVRAHSGTSSESPVKHVRTLHRYDSSQTPLHTAWMERHSTLAKDDYAVSVEQVSIFLLADNTVISFFEQSAEDVEYPIMKRLNSSATTILRRSADASLLTQAIIDTMVDLAVPVRSAYNKCRRELQINALTNPNIKTSRALHIFGEEVDMLQNLIKPIVHLVNALRDHTPDPSTVMALPPPAIPPPPPNAPPQEEPAKKVPGHQKSHHRTRRDGEGFPVLKRNQSEFQRLNLNRNNYTHTSVVITPLARTYFGDVFDHCITLISAFEQMDASASNISDLIFNTVGARTNNFMMILAMVTVFFAPLTFISGYFGMNFAGGSGLQHPFAFFWVVALPSLAAFMLIVFATMLWDQIRDLGERWGLRGKMFRRRRRGRQ